MKYLLCFTVVNLKSIFLQYNLLWKSDIAVLQVFGFARVFVSIVFVVNNIFQLLLISIYKYLTS
jgi:hypothetical protein